MLCRAEVWSRRRRLQRRSANAFLFTVALAVPEAAFAEAHDAQRLARAQALYDKATIEMDAGQFAVACPALAEVVRLIPEGMGARLTLGECLEEQGKLASAWLQFAIVEGSASKPTQVHEAATRAAALRPKLPTMKLTFPPTLGATPGLTIRRDGAPLSRIHWATSFPVDAGVHEIVVQAPGFKTWRRQVAIPVRGQLTVVELQALEPQPAIPMRGVPTKPTGLTRTTVGVATLVVGTGGLIIGAVAGASVISKNGDLAAQCNGGPCSATLKPQIDSMNAVTSVAVVSLVSGGILAATGAALWLSSPASKGNKSIATPAISPVLGPLFVGVQGVF